MLEALLGGQSEARVELEHALENVDEALTSDRGKFGSYHCCVETHARSHIVTGERGHVVDVLSCTLLGEESEVLLARPSDDV